MITKTNETRAFKAAKESNGYSITANVVTDINNVIKSIDAGDLYLDGVQVANFYKYAGQNSSITFFNDTPIVEVATEINTFINDLTNTTK